MFRPLPRPLATDANVSQRSISSIGVVIVGLFPAFMGGWVWSIAVTILCTIGAYEFNLLASRLSPNVRPFSLVLVPAFGLAAGFDAGAQALVGIAALAVGLPLIEIILRSDLKGSVIDWSLALAGSLYLGLPLVAAISIRQMSGTVDAIWLRHFADWAALGWSSWPRGLAWLLVVIVVTWLSDSGAYLVGRAIGRRPLIPVVSPKKTVEGMVGGLAFDWLGNRDRRSRRRSCRIGPEARGRCQR
jgi:phosphatidate cytidylyltransferase